MKDGKLNPRQEIFVAEYLRHGNGAKAAAAAGYSEKNAKNIACKLINHSPAVAAALAARRKAVEKAAEYNLERAMAECEEAAAFAVASKNAMALVKVVELKSRLNGLLIEKHQHSPASGFQLILSGLRGKEEHEVETDSAGKPQLPAMSSTS